MNVINQWEGEDWTLIQGDCVEVVRAMPDESVPSDTLQYTSAREHDDERHICPLQLDVVRRAMKLWTNHRGVPS